MSFVMLFLTGVGLSMDAFAVAICQGLCMKKLNWRYAAIIALFFGGFQALMPLIGWLLGSLALLALIGGNMVREALSPEEEETACAVTVKLDYKQLFLMAVATSIDALAVGVTFAFLEVEILPAITIIGCTTFVLSMAGVAVGNFFGSRYKKRAELSGGIILILLGLKILLEHLELF